MAKWTIPAQIWENKVFQEIWENKFLEKVRVPKCLGYPVGKIKYSEIELEAISRRHKFSKIKKKLMASVFSVLGNKCLYCGRPADTLDHVIPIAWGGTNDAENMQPICRNCNSKKGGKLPSRRENG